MFVPEKAKELISMLENAGFEAFLVGGCVRDSLLGKIPNDYDITTSATPEEMKIVFKNEHVIETGIKHGTLTVLREGEPFEITTFRVDGKYSDNRHPEKVEFTRSLENDLSRRDFTVNALAYSEKTGVVDLFGGVSDLEHGIVRAVGDPDVRFGEDALRIMRALRFASELGFEIEEETSLSVKRNCGLLKNVSAERLSAELIRLVCGKNAKKVLGEHSEVLFVLIPELSVLKGFDQRHFRHHLDAFGHTISVLENIPPKPVLRLSALFHDISKPLCQSIDENGTAHYYGHAHKSAEIAEEVLSRLKFDSETKNAVKTLVSMHEDRFEPTPKAVKRVLGKIGPETFEKLLVLMEADDLGKKPEYRNPESFFDAYRKTAGEIIEKDECFSVKKLAVNGSDLSAIGIGPGPETGKALALLLEKVIEGEVPNEKEKLLSYIKKE